MSMDRLLPTPTGYDSTPGGPNNHYKGLGNRAKHGKPMIDDQEADPTSQLPLLPADSLASLLVLPGSDEARKMTAGSGLRCLESLRRSDRDGLLRRTLLGSSTWGSTIVYLTWRIAATLSNRILFQLVPRAPRIDGIESSLWATITVGDVWNSEVSMEQGVEKHHLNAEAKMWPTPRHRMTGAATPERVNDENLNLETAVARTMWPTPSSQDATHGGPNSRYGSGSPHLPAAVMLPTPSARDWRSGKASQETHDRNARPLNEVVDRLMWTPSAMSGHQSGTMQEWGGRGNPTRGTAAGSGQLNPTWVEGLMGFPHGWTDIAGQD